MNKAYLISLCVLTYFISACTSTKYFVKSEYDLAQIDWEINTLNYIPINQDVLNSSEILRVCYGLLNSEKYSKLNNYLNSLNKESSDLFLAKCLFNIAQGYYKQANENLNKIDRGNYNIILDLLHIDLSYELSKMSKEDKFPYFLSQYQALIDKYIDNQQLKKIIKLRIRYVRYNS